MRDRITYGLRQHPQRNHLRRTTLTYAFLSYDKGNNQLVLSRQ